MNIYELDNGIWTGNSKAVTPFDGRPLNWVRTDVEPPTLSESEVAQWAGDGWEVLPVAPVSIGKLEEVRASRTADNNERYELAIAKMTSGYPAAEVTTWERQRAEVVAWDEDKSAATPWIDTAAAARGLERNEYLTRTLAKVNAFATASAFLTGCRQGIDDKIKSAETVEELNAIVINYTLPGASVW